MRCHDPCITEWIFDLSSSIAVTVVLYGPGQTRPLGDRAFHKLVHVWYVQMQFNRRTAECFGTDRAVIGIFIGEHEYHAAYLQFGVTNFSTWFCKSHQFGGAECSLIKIDCCGDRKSVV